jgi:hypothetical protein
MHLSYYNYHKQLAKQGFRAKGWCPILTGAVAVTPALTRVLMPLDERKGWFK